MEATHQVFKVSKLTIQKWEKQLKETGNLEKKDLHRSFRKIDPEKLKAYVAAHPDAYQSEMAETFGCSESGIRDALRRQYCFLSLPRWYSARERSGKTSAFKAKNSSALLRKCGL